MRPVALTDGMSDSEYLEVMETKKSRVAQLGPVIARIDKMKEPFYTRARQVLARWESGNDTASPISYQDKR
jgi:hypothetical protein